MLPIVLAGNPRETKLQARGWQEDRAIPAVDSGSEASCKDKVSREKQPDILEDGDGLLGQ